VYVNPHVNSILIKNPLSTQYIASFYLHGTQMYMILKCWSLLGHTFSPATAGASKVVTITLLSVTFSKNKCFKSKKNHIISYLKNCHMWEQKSWPVLQNYVMYWYASCSVQNALYVLHITFNIYIAILSLVHYR
jgi:hypothetical protein